jgi:hypothetical protein
LRVLENRLLREIFGPRKDEMTGGWRKLHIELHNLNFLPNIVRMIKLKEDESGGVCSTRGEEEKSIQNFSWNA